MIATKIIVTPARRKWSALCCPACLGRAKPQQPSLSRRRGVQTRPSPKILLQGCGRFQLLTQVLAALNRTLYSQAPAQHLHLAIFKGHCSDHRPSATWSSPWLPLSGAPSAALPGQDPTSSWQGSHHSPSNPHFGFVLSSRYLLAFALFYGSPAPPPRASSVTRGPSPLQTASPQSAPPIPAGVAHE